MTLFRQEVFDARKKRLWGDVILVQPLSHGVMTLLLAAIVFGGAAALVFGSYARTEQARGYLVPNRGLAQLYAQRAGIIEEVLVEEGQRVAAGDPLVRVRAEQLDSRGQGVESRQIALLKAQLDAMEERMGHARAVAADQASQMRAEIAGLQTEISETEERLEVQSRITQSASESFSGLDELLEKGFVARSEYERRRQAFLNQQAAETQIRQQLTTLRTRLPQARQDLAIGPENEAEALRELRSARAELEQRLVALEGQRAFTLSAPVTGRIGALQAAAGRLADPTKTLVTILPEGAELEAELLVPSSAIGFVAPGQEVRLQFDAFPYQRFGAYGATVRSVTRTILAPAEVSGPLRVEEPVYRVSVQPEVQAIDAYGQSVPLQSGMTLTASIVLERRTLLDWLLEPLRAVRARA